MTESSRSALDDAPFVLGDGAEGAAAKAAAHDVDTEKRIISHAGILVAPSWLPFSSA
jgi:hypothetical protein